MTIVSSPLPHTDLANWRRDGYLHVRGFLLGRELDVLVAAVDDIGRRPDGHHELLQHYEVTDGDRVQICRSEHLIEGYPTVRWLLTDGWMPSMAGALLGEPAVLYKEKINYKLPGGAGFSPHQDAPAYPFVDTHLTCLLAIDDATVDNGCLEMVPARHAEILPMDDRGCIRPDIADGFEWRPIPVRAGDLVWFHSRTPHRSGPNRSGDSRRGLFCTYSAARHGDLRSAYYEEKLARFTSDSDTSRTTTQVSLIGDFEGRAPRPDQLRALDDDPKGTSS